MALILSAQNETDFKPAPAGTHHATCIRIIDLGTQVSEFQNERKEQPKILIQWELNAADDPELRMSDGKPYIISKRYTASMHSKSQLAADLKSWRGRDFSIEERQAFDLKSILGKTCLLSIAHEKSKDGQKEYANIAGITNKIKGYEPQAPENEVFAFDLSEHNNKEIFEKLHDKIKEQIKASPEYNDWLLWQEPVKAVSPPQARPQQPIAAIKAIDDLDDDIPF